MRRIYSFCFAGLVGLVGLVVAAPAHSAPFQCAVTEHFYDFVPIAQFTSWTTSKTQAEAAGGYLVSIRSAAEQACLETNAVAGSWWAGGSDAAVEDVWRWKGGPDDGIQFWAGKSGGRTTTPDFYAKWFAAEPNSSGEDYMVWNTGSFGWNDVTVTNSLIAGYIVEFDFNPAAPDGDGDGVQDALDNCPNDANPGQENNDGDVSGDVCDFDDDNDGVDDLVDNCPADANPLQEDFDLDGLGNACDATFDGDAVVSEIEALVLDMRYLILSVDPPGGNGMISKLTGKGGILQKVGNAVDAFALGLIDLDTYLSELQDALAKVTAFDNQLAAKIDNGQIPEMTEGMDLDELSAEVRSIIEDLIIAVGD